MSINFSKDILEMGVKYGTLEWVKNNPEKLKDFLEFRLNLLKEEMNEAITSVENKDAEEFVDAMIDIVVVAIGNLEVLGVDTQKAWDEVLLANLAKEPGVKESRPNPLNLPDLIKPDGWKGPNHKDNHGLLDSIFN